MIRSTINYYLYTYTNKIFYITLQLNSTVKSSVLTWLNLFNLFKVLLIDGLFDNCCVIQVS